MKKILHGLGLASLCALFLCSEANAAPRQIILFVANGMGPEHARLGGCLQNGKEGSLSFESFPYRTLIGNNAADKAIPDAAAAGTAMATGKRVNTRVISKNLPGDGSDLETALESYKKQNFSTGLISTAYIEHPVTAAFASHAASKRDYDSILSEIYRKTRPDILLGGGRETGVPPPEGYLLVKDTAELQKASPKAGQKIFGRFGKMYTPYDLEAMPQIPRLSQMTKEAIRLMEWNQKGMFLVIESARLDHASVIGNVEIAAGEMAELSRAVDIAAKWAQGRPDAMVLVTSDLETGGLKLEGPCAEKKFASAQFTKKDHTGSKVPLYGMGKGAEAVKAARENTDIYKILMGRSAK